jgi:hypothetical protein
LACSGFFATFANGLAALGLLGLLRHSLTASLRLACSGFFAPFANGLAALGLLGLFCAIR